MGDDTLSDVTERTEASETESDLPQKKPSDESTASIIELPSDETQESQTMPDRAHDTVERPDPESEMPENKPNNVNASERPQLNDTTFELESSVMNDPLVEILPRPLGTEDAKKEDHAHENSKTPEEIDSGDEPDTETEPAAEKEEEPAENKVEKTDGWSSSDSDDDADSVESVTVYVPPPQENHHQVDFKAIL